MIARLLGIFLTGSLLFTSSCFLIPLLKIDAHAWPSVEGTIVDRQARRESNQSHRYAITATYEYEVQGQRHTGRRHSLAISPVQYVKAISVSEALRHAGISVGQKVRVFYDPQNPARAVLDPKVSSSQKVLYLAVIGFCGLAFLAALFGRIKRV
jgi:hypothetical protein